jgi:ferredoxin
VREQDHRPSVSVDHDLCVGHGACVRLAPAVFAMTANRQSEVINPAGAPAEIVEQAADRCPVAAIRLTHRA